jgi:hypothetical protein
MLIIMRSFYQLLCGQGVGSKRSNKSASIDGAGGWDLNFVTWSSKVNLQKLWANNAKKLRVMHNLCSYLLWDWLLVLVGIRKSFSLAKSVSFINIHVNTVLFQENNLWPTNNTRKCRLEPLSCLCQWGQACKTLAFNMLSH